MISWDDIKKANAQLIAMDIKGKSYIEVNQRIKAFRMLYPQGFIINEMISNENGICIFKSTVGYYTESGDAMTLGVGTACENEQSSYINKTSYIENCETSACGRALGMAGFGIDTSVASAEEVQNAMLNQGEQKATPKQLDILKGVYTGERLTKLLEANKLEKLEDISLTKASELIGKLKEAKK